jgi:Fe-S cluster assembly scaffold protein SufB
MNEPPDHTAEFNAANLLSAAGTTEAPAADNKFAALNSAVWSGGSFIYVPKNVKLDTPLQAYFRNTGAVQPST